jgi:hypothetical protein
MPIDPMGMEFLRKALGGGQVTEQELQQIMKSSGSPFAQGMSAGLGGAPMGSAAPQIGNLGSGAPAPIQMPQMMGSSDQRGQGPNPMLMQMLASTGGGHATQAPNGDWMPGPQGFPAGGMGNQGGGVGQMALSGIRTMMGGK